MSTFSVSQLDEEQRLQEQQRQQLQDQQRQQLQEQQRQQQQKMSQQAQQQQQQQEQQQLLPTSSTNSMAAVPKAEEAVKQSRNEAHQRYEKFRVLSNQGAKGERQLVGWICEVEPRSIVSSICVLSSG